MRFEKLATALVSRYGTLGATRKCDEWGNRAFARNRFFAFAFWLRVRRAINPAREVLR